MSSTLTPPSGTGVTAMRPVLVGVAAEFDGREYSGGAVAEGGAGLGCFLWPHAAIPTAAINPTARHTERRTLA
ncbi:MAG: hypothetical protein WBQ95_05095 [Terracidiphilus sp.]